MIRWGNLKGAAQVLTQISREMQYSIQTSQAVDWIAGGQKINALPEFVTVGVNHRYAPQDSIGEIEDRIVHLVEGVTRKYGLDLQAFKGDEDYEKYLAAKGITSHRQQARHLWEPKYNGAVVLQAKKKSHITPQSPTSGPIWDVFAGTVRHTFAREASTVVVAPGATIGNTDSRHYLSKWSWHYH
jgi:Gly-Xaa carboxypeptidase